MVAVRVIYAGLWQPSCSNRKMKRTLILFGPLERESRQFAAMGVDAAPTLDMTTTSKAGA